MPTLTSFPDGNWTGEWGDEGPVPVPCIECGNDSRYSVPGSGVWYCVGCWARKGLWEEATGGDST